MTPLAPPLAPDANGTIYVGSRDKKFYAVNSDGSLKWFIETGGAIESSAAIDKDCTIYIASTDGKLYAIGEKMELYP